MTSDNPFLRAEKHLVAEAGGTPVISGAGVYLHSSPDSTQCLRFYDDGRVISVSLSEYSAALANWFSWQHQAVSRGRYYFDGQVVALTTTSETGTVAYSGTVNSLHQLVLNSYSFINGHHAAGEEFKFIELACPN